MTLRDVEHQAARVARLFASSFLAQIVAYDVFGDASDRKTITAAIVAASIAAGEATYRKVFPTLPAPKALVADVRREAASLNVEASRRALAETAEQIVESLQRDPEPTATDDVRRLDDHGVPVP